MRPPTDAEIIAYLRDRLAEDEAVALACIPQPHLALYRTGATTSLPRWEFAADSKVRLVGECLHPTLVTQHTWPNEGAHIARWDPARALAEVRLWRDILDLHESTEAAVSAGLDSVGRSGFLAATIQSQQIVTWKLAQYSSRDDFPKEWRL